MGDEEMGEEASSSSSSSSSAPVENNAEMDEIDRKYGLDTYDDDDETDGQRVFSKLEDLIVPDDDEILEDDDEDDNSEADLRILASDSILIGAITDQDEQVKEKKRKRKKEEKRSWY